MNTIILNLLARTSHYCHFDDFTLRCLEHNLYRFKEFLERQSILAGFNEDFLCFENPNILSLLDDVATKRSWYGGMYEYKATVLGDCLEKKDRVTVARHLLQEVHRRGSNDTIGLPTHWIPETAEYENAPPECVHFFVYVTIGKLYKFLGYKLEAIYTFQEALTVLSELIKIWDDRLNIGVNALLVPAPISIIFLKSSTVISGSGWAIIPAGNTNNRGGSYDTVSQD